MSKRIDKRVWGVLGKQQTYFSPQKQIEGKTKTPLNANAFDSWDAKRSRFKRVDGYENAIQQGGTVIGQTTSAPVSSPTPTPSFTPTQTLTPTITPSSTPYPIVQPSLWFDASDSSTMNLILSGGTTYISQITSKGTDAWVLTGTTTNRYPIYSASTLMPGSPNIIRFTPNTTITSRQGFTSFGNTPIYHSGATLFAVFAQPSGGTATQLNVQTYSGLTNGGLQTSGATGIYDRATFTIVSNIAFSNIFPQGSSAQVLVPAPFTGTSLNDKYLFKGVLPYPTGIGSWELNQSGGTGTQNFTGTTITPMWNNIFLGGTITSSASTQTFNNNNIELCELMIYNTSLTSAEQEAVELYLRDKWRYDEWASPVPTPTPTPSPTTP